MSSLYYCVRDSSLHKNRTRDPERRESRRIHNVLNCNFTVEWAGKDQWGVEVYIYSIFNSGA